MAKSLISAPVPVPRLIPSVVNADPAVLARESTAHADAILRQSDRASTAQTTADAASSTATDARNASELNVKVDFGAKGDGDADDTVAIQAAIDGSTGRILRWPKGEYKITSTLRISTRSNHWVGDFSNNASVNGTQITFWGTGPCVQIGVDNGHAWSASDYDGPQDQVFDSLYFAPGSVDSPLAGTGAAGNFYKAGAYGIWDWRGGSIFIKNCGFQQFEASFVGINSDFTRFDHCRSNYSPYGIYLGPLSDQVTILDLDSFLCDRCVTIDGAHQTRIIACDFEFSGTNVASTIEVRLGSSGTSIEYSWFERSGGGYQGTDAQSFFSIGEVSGYGPGGSISSPGGAPNLTLVHGVAIRDAHFFTVLPGVPSHTKFMATVGTARQVLIDHPQEYGSSALANFDRLVCVQVGSAPIADDTQVEIRGVGSHFLPTTKLFQNLGAGAPVFTSLTNGTFGAVLYANNSIALQASTVLISNSVTGTGTRASAPGSGSHVVGEIVFNSDPIASGFIGWVCVTSGTPGTWKSWGPISA